MNNICSERNVILYIEGELPEVEMLKMEAHFAHCKLCQLLLEQHRLIRLGLKWDVQVDVPPDFALQIMEKLPTPFENFLSTAREKIIALAAFICFSFLGLFSYMIGTKASNLTDLLSPKWWDKTILAIFEWLTNSFKITLQLVKTISTIGLFLLKEAVFILGIMGKVLISSPHAHIAMLLSVMILSLSVYFVLSKQQRRPSKARVTHR